MNKAIKIFGDLFAILGLLVCAVAGIARVFHHYHIAGFESLTLFIIGIAVMVASVLAKVHLLQNS